MSADGEFSERLLSAALLGCEMYLWLLCAALLARCCLPASFNKKPSAVLGRVRLIPVLHRASVSPRQILLLYELFLAFLHFQCLGLQNFVCFVLRDCRTAVGSDGLFIFMCLCSY